MKIPGKIVSLILPVMAAVMLITAIGFVENKQFDKTCQEVVIDIDSQYDNYFVGKGEVMFLITGGGTRNLLGSWWRDIDLKTIEKELLTHKFISTADVYKDLEGRLLVDVFQKRPIARLAPSDGVHAYVSSEGEILPVSESFTSRVMLVGGALSAELTKADLNKSKQSSEILNLLNYIDQDPFWKAQIAALEIDNRGEVTIHPQVTKQTIVFGSAEDLELKFKKLEIFYQEILPQKGWNHYTKVNLKYHNQIVCE